VFWLNSQVLACALKSMSPKRQIFLNQINKEIRGISGPVLCPRRCFTRLIGFLSFFLFS
jgi:hypothetical protein